MIAYYFESLIESVLIVSFFYLLFVLLFNKEASFRQNRLFLLLGVLLGLVIPFIDISVPESSGIEIFAELKTIDIFGNNLQQMEVTSSFSWKNILYTLYFIGVIIFLLRFLYQLFRVFRFKKNAEILASRGVKLVYTGKRHSVFSFLNSIFIDDKSKHSSDLDIIINHERVHVAQMHSIDLLLFELLAIVQWFNPIVWLYRKSIKQNHEFLADKGSLDKGFSMEKYQEVLLQNYSFLSFGLANSFNHSLTFKRLIMMKKNNSNKKSVVKLIVLLPLLLASVYFISCSKDNQSIKESNTENLSRDLKSVNEELEEEFKSDSKEVVVVTNRQIEPGEKVFDMVEVAPEFPGGELELRKFIAINVKYPSQAKKKGIQGKVYVKFVVDKTGAVSNVEVVRSVDPLLDAEAVRVLSSLPDWTPGENEGKPVNVHFTVPINFQLQ